jgi:hypothetical protein
MSSCTILVNEQFETFKTYQSCVQRMKIDRPHCLCHIGGGSKTAVNQNDNYNLREFF